MFTKKKEKKFKNLKKENSKYIDIQIETFKEKYAQNVCLK